VLTLRYNALLSAFSVILAAFLFLVISVVIMGAIVSPREPIKISKRTTRVHCTYSNPEPPVNVLFWPRKDAEVPDLNALKLCETRGFRGQFHTESMFLGQKKYIFGRFRGHMGTINTSTQSGMLRMRLYVSTRVPAEVTSFWSDRWINVFEVEVEVDVDVE